MIIFLQGLPRSGKSLYAVSNFIIPALQDGKRVFSNISGLNSEKLSAVSGVDLEQVKSLLFPLKKEDLLPENIGKLAAKYALDNAGPTVNEQGEEEFNTLFKDCLLVFDEVQNLFSSANRKIHPDALKFIAEHGHQGIDIILMSQAFKSVHKEWRVRTQSRYTFVKRTAIGKPDSFKWVAEESQGDEKFQEISSGTDKYDSKYFDCYKSHHGGVENKGHKVDEKLNIFKSGLFRHALPAFVIVLLAATAFLYHFFTKPSVKVNTKNVNPVSETATVNNQMPVKALPPVSQALAQVPQQTVKLKSVDYFEQRTQGNQIRLIGRYSTPDKPQECIIEVLNDDLLSLERFKCSQLVRMGWRLKFEDFGIELVKDDYQHWATSWHVIALSEGGKSENVKHALSQGVSKVIE